VATLHLAKRRRRYGGLEGGMEGGVGCSGRGEVLGKGAKLSIYRPFMKPVAVVIEYSGLKSKFRGTQGGAIR
jgi:hypothetical protein